MVPSAGAPVGELLAVNVGMPRDVPWQDRTVRTAVWKRPVSGRCGVRRLGVEGDGQGDLAGHGGVHRAVFVYQIDSYRYWERKLGRSDFELGQFGENLTVRGLADAHVCIGDRYAVGDALFEVTQPRVTCYRIGIRMSDPRMPALLVADHRPGFYLRVLTEGSVAAGDQIVKVASGPEGMSVADIDALLYLPGHPREELERALRIPALSPGWQASFRAILEQPAELRRGGGNAGLTAAAPAPAWPGFRPLTVTAIERESETVTSVRLADPHADALPAPLPGQFLTLRLPGGEDRDGRPLVRSYSLSGPPGAGAYRVSVKREPHGAAGRFVHTRLDVADTLEVAAPRGSFTLRPGDGPVLLISAGVGATPVLAMLHALVADRSQRQVWWLHGARSGAESPFALESRELLARLAHARRQICFSHPGPRDVLGRDYDRAGRLSATVLGALELPRDADAYLCGPASFMVAVATGLVGNGIAEAAIHTEVFGVGPAMSPGIEPGPARAPHPPEGRPGAGPLVAFLRSDQTVPWDPAYGSLLGLAEACDVPVRWSCRTGVCHSCESGLLSGAVDHDPVPVDAPAEGSVLICSARPLTDLMLDL